MAGFNEEQQQVIDLRDCNILVSAAAGSGKTTVLVERIIRRILDPVDPVNIDEMLVLTYTNAAAGEMRERIGRAINQALEADPHNEHLLKQVALIYNAQITTIDSFCLNILRNNFTEIGLEPGFRPASNSEIKFLEEEVLDDVVEELFEADDIEGLEAFLERFESKDSISKIRNSIKLVYDEVLKAPFVLDCIEERRSDYKVSSVADLKQAEWFLTMFDTIRTELAEVNNMLEGFHDFILQYGPEEYIKTYEADKLVIDGLCECNDYDALRERVNNLEWVRIATAKGCDPVDKETAKGIRDSYKKIIKDEIQARLAMSAEDILSLMSGTGQVVDTLLTIVERYYNRLGDAKRKKGIVTFADMEHMALQILLRKNEAGEYVPTQTALDYRKIYKEIMIDEYQDSNDTQELLLSAISTESEGIYNRFIVGDMKQSIYRFRNAKPELFKSKYDEYSKEEGSSLRRINLSKNYRSRTSVIECVNAIFEKMMDSDLGGIVYDADSRLYCAGDFVDTQENVAAELVLMEASSDSEYNKREQEALLIAHKIKSLVGNYLVMNDTRTDMRPCTYRDMVILLRSGAGYDEILRRIMEQEGVPAYITSKNGYFDAVEIVSILNYLAILDNPYVDIPMYGTLTGLFGEFTEDDIALLKIVRPESSIYEAVRFCSEASNIESERNESIDKERYTLLLTKCQHFIDRYCQYRDKVPYTPIHKLIREILKDHNYMDNIISMPLGEQKAANVRMLLTKAESFEEDGFRGLFHFNRYIENIHRYGSDDGDAVTLDENADVVRIMTMHKSKGLEFPICILAGIDKEFNTSDSKGEIIFHDRLGMGLDYIDSKRRIKIKDIRKSYIAKQIKHDGLAEEIRVLYVAMTRAKEKMIMIACVNDIEKELEKSQVISLGGNSSRSSLSLFERSGCKNYLDMILKSRGDNDWNGQLQLTVEDYSNVIKDEIEDTISSEELKKQYLSYLSSDIINEEAEKMIARITRKYPFEYLSGLYHKTSVSELKMAAIHDAILNGSMEEVPDSFFKVHEPDEYIPDFAREEATEASGAARGTAYHRVMELIDYANVEYSNLTEEYILNMMKNCVDSGEIMEDELALVSIKKVKHFLESDLGKRMVNAAKNNRLYLEQPFVLGIPAKRLRDELPDDRTVMIQGIIDVFFEEDDGIVLMDYKTDHVKQAQELIDRYMTQIDYYDEAITRIREIKVKERLIYSFALEETIEL